MLWGRAANRCAFATCRTELVIDATETDDESLIGEECHIVARKENGPRGESDLIAEKRNQYSNLILLCAVHHKMIDDQPREYTVEYLKNLKTDHESWVKNTLRQFDQEKKTADEHYSLFYVEGSSFKLIEGIAGTREKTNGHHSSLFPMKTTVILGDSNKQPPFNNSNYTIASWNIPIREVPGDSNAHCFLVFGCMRFFGGLHSPVANDFVDIYLNDHPIDGFEIRIIPEGQTDFFHQRPYPDIPKLYPFSMCENLYVWPFPATHLSIDQMAHVLVRVAKRTKWDIDYVGLMFEGSSTLRKSNGL